MTPRLPPPPPSLSSTSSSRSSPAAAASAQAKAPRECLRQAGRVLAFRGGRPRFCLGPDFAGRPHYAARLCRPRSDAGHMGRGGHASPRRVSERQPSRPHSDGRARRSLPPASGLAPPVSVPPRATAGPDRRLARMIGRSARPRDHGGVGDALGGASATARSSGRHRLRCGPQTPGRRWLLGRGPLPYSGKFV